MKRFIFIVLILVAGCTTATVIKSGVASRTFSSHAEAQIFTDELKLHGYAPAMSPAHYLGPRETFGWGWLVTWQTNKSQ